MVKKVIMLVLCVCMMATGIGTVVKADSVPDTRLHYIVKHWHIDGSSSVNEGYISPGDKSLSIPLDIRQKGDIKLEEFAGYTISAGHSAVTETGEGDDSMLEIQYDPNIHLVKAHVFYKATMVAQGENFGENLTEGGSVDPEVDTKIEDEVKIYNTSAGLHTDKSIAEVVDPDKGSDGRTFDLTLESWYAGDDLADVGLILDASGSMAFTSTEAKMTQIILDSKEMGVLIDQGYVPGEPLSLDQINWILDNHYTDQSKLGYSDYTYYVYDKRDNTQEYTPLGYWDGNAVDTTTVNVTDGSISTNLSRGLLGYYAFDGNLENGVGEGSASYIGLASEDDGFDRESSPAGEASPVYGNNGLKGDKYLVLNDAGSAGTANKGNVLLDVVPTQKAGGKDSFTISFAIKEEEKKGDPQPTVQSDILFIGDLTKENVYHEIFRGEKGSKNRLRWVEKEGEYRSNKNNVFSDKGGNWKVITYVVENGKLTTYIDGNDVMEEMRKDSSNTSLDVNFQNPLVYDENLGIIVGGTDSYDPNYPLYIDELYVYDRSLSASEVEMLAEETKKSKTEDLLSGLLGYYPFDGSLVNAVNLQSPVCIGKFSGDQFSSAPDPSVTPVYSSEGARGDKDQSLSVSATGANGNILLDVVPTEKKAGDSFTISFAVKGEKGEENPLTPTDIFFLGNVDEKYDDHTFHEIFRAEKTSTNRLKWNENTATSSNINDVFKDDSWNVITYVVENGKVTTYMNGAPASENGTGKIENSLSYSNLGIIIGGMEEYDQNWPLYLDELYIYDRALSAEQVKALYGVTTTAKSGDTVYGALNSKGSVMGLIYPYNFKGNSAEGWYYVTSSSNWENFTNKNIATAKVYRGLPALEADSKTNVLLYEGFTINGEGVDESTADLATRVSEMDHDQPSVFFIADSGDGGGELWCYFSPSNNNSDGISLVYSPVWKKDDDSRIKVESLQYALGQFVSELSQDSPQSRVAAVRFSTDNAENDLDKLVLLDWTSDPVEAADILGLQRGDGSSIAEQLSVPSSENDNLGLGRGILQYNYGLTGGTNTWTGFQAFDDYLNPRVRRDSSGERTSKKYIILFTDGKDDDAITGSGVDENDKAIQYATKLKNEGYTIFCVMLQGGPNTFSSAEAFLNLIAGPGEGSGLAADGHYVFSATNSDELLNAFMQEILPSIAENLDSYCVKDYIDPRFDLVDATGNVIHLLENGEIQIGDQGETLSAEGKEIDLNNTADEDAQSAILKWDSDNHMYYLLWENQTIPGCAISAEQLRVWSSTVRIKAKEDFIGGNAVLTNGNDANMNMVFSPDDEDASSGTDDAVPDASDALPSKGFPRTTANVKLLEPVMGNGEKVIYLGETIKPEAILQALGGTMDTDSDEYPDEYPGSKYYWEYLDRFAKKNSGSDNYWNWIVDNWFIDSEDYGLAGTLEIPYYYLSNTAGTNQTGTDGHREDQIGTLTYKLEFRESKDNPEEFSDWQSVNSIDSYLATDTKEKQYRLTVIYNALPEKTEEELSDDRGKQNDKLIVEEENGRKLYHTPSAAVGTSQTQQEVAGEYKISIVEGELVLRMRIKEDDFNYLKDHLPPTEGQPDLDSEQQPRTIKYEAKVNRTYDETIEKEIGTLTAEIDLDKDVTEYESLEVDGEPYIFVNAHIEITDKDILDNKYEYLPIGTYALVQEKAIGSVPFKFSDIEILPINNNNEVKDGQSVFTIVGPKVAQKLEENAAPYGDLLKNFYLGTGSTEAPNGDKWPVTPAGLSTASAGTGAASPKENETLADYLMDRLGIWLISGELQLGNLKISKTVDSTALGSGNRQADPTEFTFSLDLYQQEPSGESEVPRLTGNYSYQIYQKSSVKGGKDETVGDPGEFDASKTIEFALKDGQYIVIEELPAGAYYTVTEQSKDGYTASIVKTAGAVAGTASIAGTAETIDGVSASGTISDNEQAEVAYTNTYSAEGELLLPVIKELTGRPWMEGDTFTFRLQTKDTNTFNAVEGGDITLPEGMDWKKYDDSYYYFDITISDSAAENSSEKKGAFNLFFHKLTSADKPYKFEISELSGSNEALTYADEKYEVEITVQEKTQKEGEHVGQVVRDGKLDVLQSVIKVEDGSAEGCEEVRFVNKYAADAEVTVPVTKNIEGREWLDGEIFSFQLKAVNVDALKDALGEGSLHFGDGETPIKSGDSYEITVGKDAKGEFKLHFANISFGEGETRKTFIFSICEVEKNHPQDGLTYDKNVYTLKVVLTPGKEELNVTVTDEDDNEVDLDLDPVSFTNQYASSGELMWPPVVNKTLTGRPWKDSDQFVFEMIPSETTKTAIEQGDILGPNGETLDLSSQPLQVTVNSRITANEDGSRSQAFGNLRFTKVTLPGEPYEFIIKEVIPPENSDGIDYDLVEYTVQIVVVDDNMGNLTPQVTYKKDGEPLEAGQSAAGLPFTNAYSADGSLSIPVFKELQGRNWAQGDSFTFTLSPDMDDEETKTAFDEGHICFSKDGNDPSGSVLDSIQIVIPAEGSENHEGEFRLWFRDITFAKTDASGNGVAEYKFKVQEEEGDIAGIQYITDPCILMVTLTEQDGKVTAEVEAGTIPEGISFDSENGGLTFTNIYKNSGSISIPVTKVLEGRDWTDEDAFTIELAATDEAKEAVDSGKIILQADSVDTQAGTASVTITKNTSDQQGSFTIEFADLDFSGGATPKVFEFPFVIKEVLPSQANGENPYQGVQYDITEYDLTVTVTDDGKGTLDAKVTSVTPENKAKWNQATGTLALTFTNIYSESGVMEWPPKVSKTLEGRDWNASDIFTFKLTPTGDVTPAAIDDGKIVMPENADPQDHSISVQLDQANTTKAFDNITFKAATEPEGEYEFTISEVEPEGAEDHVLNGITYSDTVYTLKVKVTSDGRGNLTAVVTEVTSSDGTVLSVPIGALPFTNTYSAAGQIEIPVTKVLTGREWLDGDRFVFTLEMPPEAQYGEDVKLPDEKQLILGKQGDIITSEGKFAPITFTKPGEYVFLVREQSGDAENLTYDTACRTVTVEVTDNGDGTLSTEIIKVEVEQQEEVATGNDDNSADGLTFTNTYTAPTFEPVSVDLPVEKILDGRDWQEGDVFTFTLKPESDYGDAVELPGTSVSVEYAEGDNEHTAQFGPIKFKKEGTYSFTVTEEIPEGAEEPQLLMADVTSMQPLIIELPEEELEETETEETETEETETWETETEETQSEETQPEETQSEETQPEATQPEETQPEETQPEETQPEATQSEETQPEATQPEGTQPEESQPEATQSEALQPEESQPEALQSEESQPEESQPEALQSEEPQPVESQPAEVGARFTYETVYSVEGISSELIPTSLPEDSLQDGLSETVAESSVGSEDPQEPPVETQTVLEESEAEPEEIGAGEKEEQTPFMPMGLLDETNEDGGTVKSYGVMTYSRAKYTVKVEVTADVSSGALKAVVSINGEEWNGSDPMTFTNTYQVQQGEPETQPSEPETPPSEPETQPSEPETPPSEPETQPSEPETQPSEPETPPSEPETQPSEPETPPSEPQTQPSEPQTQPAIPETSGEPERPGVPVVQREETQSPETWEPVAIETQTETPSVDSADAMGIQNERDTGEKSAQTGDESDILIVVYVSLMVSAGSIIAAILQRRRKKDNR